MIARLLTPAETLFRMMTPQWAGSPTSGAGAAMKGGRFNRPGTEAVYLSFDPSTALDEYSQGSPFMPPGTLASFTAEGSIIDLEAFIIQPAGWSLLWNSWNCNWRELAFSRHIEPPAWGLGDLTIAAGHNGIRFPSIPQPGGWNAVLYPQTFGNSTRLVCLDPNGLLARIGQLPAA